MGLFLFLKFCQHLHLWTFFSETLGWCIYDKGQKKKLMWGIGFLLCLSPRLMAKVGVVLHAVSNQNFCPTAPDIIKLSWLQCWRPDIILPTFISVLLGEIQDWRPGIILPTFISVLSGEIYKIGALTLFSLPLFLCC